jgi:molybdopterin-biosynthesis enzyme MoeA-like protein
MTFGLFIIGDEILSGKRQDKHLSKVIELLAARGLALGWAQVLGDGEQQIAEAVATSRARGDIVLSCGGIGATPDDQTRQAAARGFGLLLKRHAGAEALIIERNGEKAFPSRVLMADFPEGAGLIPNPVNRVAGFYIGDHNFVPGFPEMAWPMLEWVLDTRYAHLHNANPPVEFSLRALGTAAESDLLYLMEQTLAQFPEISLSSLPSRGDSLRPRHIEFGIKGPREIAARAFLAFREGLTHRPEIEIEDIRTP